MKNLDEQFNRLGDSIKYLNTTVGTSSVDGNRIDYIQSLYVATTKANDRLSKELFSWDGVLDVRGERDRLRGAARTPRLAKPGCHVQIVDSKGYRMDSPSNF
ncbi:hypothetical protein ASPWEDRAFT_477733 [Aspergillus wentii DTO 134E9]|uniref:Uncharacterized protein n=1 Tax=Aspergillus wentii DTO 134E9 TaxID=1073089 RepID=A0A1L9RIQ3_ASPWE|nr:uncharacterized protein ASPWEDRAFT_477733 [Aspergillus wentii DTO 134E9]OJJ34802.1 hypothetical protein ASPWEDRAFT_477733 [Aspergillus wentii DTO 134E9]